MKIDSSISTIQKLSTGLRINSAKDDAAGLAISEKLVSQNKGLEQGVENAQQSQDALNTADAALSGVGDSLQRIRELAVQASNGILTSDERGIIQQEIDSLKQGISDQVSGAQFNTKPLLDGSFQDVATASQADGSGPQLNINGSTLSDLGIENFNVTEDFSIDDIDSAIQAVSENRSQIGAQTNGIESTIRSNQTANENTIAANSRLRDADVALEFSRLSQQNIIQQYQVNLQQQQQNQARNALNLIL
jgi:flagellin